MNISKVIIPAAGLGTRFLPFTKAVAKELLPIINAPAIQYVVQEGIDAGISQFIMITSKGKDALINYFDAAPELEQALAPKKRLHLIDDVRQIMHKANFIAIRQGEPKGLGHAIAMARHVVNPDEYIGVMLPDDVIMGAQSALGQLIAHAQKHNASVIAVQRVPKSEISQYGSIAYSTEIEPGLYQMQSVVEKPKAEEAPSDLAIIGRYVLHPSLFAAIDAITPLAKDEIQLTDAMNYMIEKGHRILACEVVGTRYDLGRPMGWLTANIEMALQNPEYAQQIKKLVK